MQSPGLAAAQREHRLIACLRIWLHRATPPAESEAAMAAAVRILKARNIAWDAPPYHESLIRLWRAISAAVAKRPDDMRSWERRFAAAVLGELRTRALEGDER